MQAAAPSEAQTQAAAAGTPRAHSSAHGRQTLRGLPVPGHAPAPEHAGARGKKTRPPLMLEALEKALAAASRGKHAPAAVHGAGTEAARPALSAQAGAVQALVADAAPHAAHHPAHAEAAEGRKPARRKAAHETSGAQGAEGIALALAHELLALFQGPAALKGGANAGVAETLRETAPAQAAAKKAADSKIHVVDARRNSSQQAADQVLLALRPQQPQPSERDALLALVHELEGGKERSAPPAQARQQPPGPSAFAAALDRVQQMNGADMVRTSGIILRDGGGEIKLVLKPESLGSVRIRMNLVDNSIEGRIIVDNPAVKQVFDGNLPALMRALTAEGFQTASLQVSVGGQNAHQERSEQDAAQPVRRVSAEGFERNVPGAETMSLGDLLVNLFV